MRRMVLAALFLLVALAPAEAHKLKVFATVAGGEIGGYAFFIGGGRVKGAVWTARMGGEELAGGRTDTEGGFHLPVPARILAEIAVTVDTQEGHFATATLPPARFEGTAAPAPVHVAGDGTAPPTSEATGIAPAPDQAALARVVETAMQRQIAPLEAQIAEMQDRLRLTDIISGLMFIAGLAGVGLWLRGRGAA